jgi:exosortase/archaeosortase family protein
VPTGINRRPRRVSSAVAYVLRAVVTGLGFFGLLRLPWIETHLVWPVTLLQSTLAVAALGTPVAPISVTLACSGTEVIAMCLGAVLAYPVRWRSRLTGAVGIITGILALNTVRIGTLGLVAGQPQWFDVLHLYLWPTVLMLGAAGAVMWWMRRADATMPTTVAPSLQFAGLALVLITVSALTAPLYLESRMVRVIGDVIAGSAAVLLRVLGATVYATGNVLWTTRGGFSVTGDCVATPMLPLYLAAVWTWARSWPRLLLGTVAAVPLFLMLGVVRLLLVALPQTMGPSPEFAAHAFYQVLLGVVMVVLAGRWRRHATGAVGPVVIGLAAAVVGVGVAGPLYTSAVMWPGAPGFPDPQGAVAFLPSFQLGLYLALWIALGHARHWWLPVLGVVTLVALHTVGAWWLTMPGVTEWLAAHVSAVRAWAVAGPVVVMSVVMAVDGRAVQGQ